jgi:Gluconate 2-dehydrogenase subunit 3
MKRREFLKTSALVVAGATAAASGVPVIAFADQPQWASLKTLDKHQADTLLKITRQIFPHDNVPDAPYAKVVIELDTEASAAPDTAKLLRDGVEQIDTVNGASFASLPADQQVVVLEKISKGPFFQKVHAVELQTLYSDPEVWKVLGYQGPSFRYGGYLHRGFNDLTWLPNPPESASPKAS